MRLGAYECQLIAGSLAERLYGSTTVRERHRHRYEVNNAYRERMAKAGMVCSGLSPDYRLVEIVEIPRTPSLLEHSFTPNSALAPTERTRSLVVSLTRRFVIMKANQNLKTV